MLLSRLPYTPPCVVIGERPVSGYLSLKQPSCKPPQVKKYDRAIALLVKHGWWDRLQQLVRSLDKTADVKHITAAVASFRRAGWRAAAGSCVSLDLYCTSSGAVICCCCPGLPSSARYEHFGSVQQATCRMIDEPCSENLLSSD